MQTVLFSVLICGQCLHYHQISSPVQAFCETLEESNYRLQKELLEKQKEIASLKRMLEAKEEAILQLEKQMKSVYMDIMEFNIHTNRSSEPPLFPSGEYVSPDSPYGLSTQGSESSADVDVESSAAEADQDMPDDVG